MTEKGRDEVLRKLQQMRETYQKRIEQSKSIKPREWLSHGSETEVDDFLIRSKRGFVSKLNFYKIFSVTYILSYAVDSNQVVCLTLCRKKIFRFFF